MRKVFVLMQDRDLTRKATRFPLLPSLQQTDGATSPGMDVSSQAGIVQSIEESSVIPDALKMHQSGHRQGTERGRTGDHRGS